MKSSSFNNRELQVRLLLFLWGQSTVALLFCFKISICLKERVSGQYIAILVLHSVALTLGIRNCDVIYFQQQTSQRRIKSAKRWTMSRIALLLPMFVHGILAILF